LVLCTDSIGGGGCILLVYNTKTRTETFLDENRKVWVNIWQSPGQTGRDFEFAMDVSVRVYYR